MEKNENEELLEQSPAEIQQEDTPEIAKSGEEEPDTEEQKVSNGRFILWSLAGVYLLYTSYSLCKGYVTGEEGTSMGFMLAGIAFAAIGAGLLFFGIKNMLSEEKIRKAKAAKNAVCLADGSSSTLWTSGKGVVNHPVGNDGREGGPSLSFAQAC